MVKAILCFLCGFWIFTNDASGQDQKVVDSLLEVLTSQRGGERYPALHKLAVEYVDLDNEKAFEFILQAEQAALFSGDSLSIVKSKRAKGQILFRLGRIPELISNYSSILPVAQRHGFVNEAMMIVNSFGNAYLYQCQYDKALQYYLRAYEMSESENDASGMATIFNNMGITYYKLTDFKKGLFYLKRSFAIRKSINEVFYDTPMNISLCYVQLKDFHNARRYLNESLNYCGSDCPDQFMIHISYAWGCLFLGLKQYVKAEAEFLKSYSYSKEVGDSRMQLDNIYLLSELYIKQMDSKKAISYLDKGEKIIFQGVPFNLEMINIYAGFSEIYLATRDFEKASFYQSKYIALKDSIYNEALTTSLMKTEAEYLEHENMAKIAAQDEVILLKEEIINRQWLLNIVVSLLGFITFGFLVLLFRSHQQKKQMNALLDKKVAQRTGELALSRDELLMVLKERDLLISRASNDIAETINTIRGLCFIGLNDVSGQAVRTYMEKIDKTSNRFAGKMNYLLEDKS